MKKRIIISIITVAVLAVLGVGLWILLDTDEVKPEDKLQLVNKKSDELYQVRVTLPDHEFVMEWSTDSEDTSVFKILGFAGETSASRAFNVKLNSTLFRANRLVEENVGDLSKYGLTKPRGKITIYYTDATTFTFFIGDTTPNQAGAYICLEGGNDVYSIFENNAQSFLQRPDYYRVMPSVTIAMQNISAFVVQTGEQRRSFALLEASLGLATWEMLEPYRHNASSDALETYVEAIVATVANEFVEENPDDLAKYGLEVVNDYVTVIGGADQSESFTVFFGDYVPNDNSKRYAMFTGSNNVYTVQVSTLTYLDTSLFSLIEQYIAFYNIKYIDNIIVKEQSRELLYKIERTLKEGVTIGENDDRYDESKYNNVFSFDGEVKNEEQARSMYAAYVGLKIDGEYNAVKGHGEVILEMEYEFNIEGMRNINVKYCEYDIDHYAVILNDTPAFYIRKQKINTIIEKNQKFIDNTLPTVKEEAENA